MFSLIRRVLNRARLFDALLDRVDKIEAKLERFEKLADENESLWQFLDEQKEMSGVWTGSAADFEAEFTDIMVRSMKSRGDA